MEVLVIPSWYPNGEDKLMGVYHKEFCDALAINKNINVNMLFIERERLNKPLKYIFMKKDYVIKENGYKTYVKRMLNVERISFKWQLKRYVKVLDQAFKMYLKDNNKPDIIHAQVTIPAGYAACKLGKKYGIPVIITEHASYFNDFFKGEYNEYTKFALKYAYFTTVSNYMLENLPSYVKKMGTIPNLVDTSIFKPNKKKIKGLRLIAVSAFRKGKRIEDMLDALNIIINDFQVKDVCLTIVGDGYAKNYYLKRCDELNLRKYVNFVGRKEKKKEVAQILKQNNIFVNTSVKETFCIPAVEALACGIPVVSTKCFGPEEYIDSKCGKLVEVGNPLEIAKAIIEVYKNLDKYDEQYLRLVASNYSRENVINKTIEMYQRVIGD